jgi:PAS domain S-box-containing protein
MRHPLRILSIEDDPKDAGLIQDLFEAEGIVCEITRVDTQASLLDLLQQGGVDLILADYSLPSFDGISALKLANKVCPEVPFIFVSGTLGEEVAIEALKIGATDYVLKTRLSRLVPSVQRALREATQKAERKRAEEALRQSETYLAEAQRLSHTGSFGWKPSTGAIIWSEETFRIFQCDRTTTPTVELILQRVHPEDAALVQQTIERATQDEKDFEQEYRLLMPDGSIRHLHIVARPLNDESGSVEFVGAVMDVTERKRAAEALLRTEAYLAEGQKLSHTGTWACNIATREMIHSSEEHRHLFGLVPERVGIPSFEEFYQHIHPDDRGPTVVDLERAMTAGTDIEAHFRVVLPEGTTRYMYGTGHPLVKPAGEAGEFVGTVMDVTAAKLAEQTLRESEAYLAEAQRLSHTGSWASSPATGEIRFLSAECYRVLGFDPHGGRPRYETFYQRIHPDDQATVRGTVETAARDKSGFEFDYRIVHPGGNIRDIHAVGHPVFSPSGDLVEFVGSVMDITERKRAESLRDGERRILEMIAGDAPLEEILEKLVRVVEAQFGGLLCSVLLLDEDGQRARHGAAPSLPESYVKAIDGLCIGPKAGSCGTAMYRKEPVVVTDILHDPLWEPYRAIAQPYGFRACWSTPILAQSGKVLGSFAVYDREPHGPSPAENRVLDMATHLAGIAIERKVTHEQLQRSEAYLAEGQRLAHTGSWAFNARKAIYWSEENFRIWGFDPQQGLPERETVLDRIHPEDRDRLLEYVQKAVREKTDYAVDFRIVLPGGTVRHIHGLGHPVFSATGELVEVVGTQLDVTERKRAEEEHDRLREAQAALAHINRVTTVGELTASLAHEVNQPIAAVATDANTCLRWLARDQPDLKEARAAASRVVKDAARAAEIMSRIRSLFKKEIAQRELVDVNDIIRGMIDLLRSEATRYSISMRTELGEDLPRIMGDRVQLQQVTMNLIINSIDAMKDVEGTREIAIKSQRAKNEQLQVSVIDTGLGLPSQRADQIFNAFFTTKPHGTGMGLRISRSIIESHGGRLWAADNFPRGACFAFTLPAKIEGHE